jgi:hypothetical protein
MKKIIRLVIFCLIFSTIVSARPVAVQAQSDAPVWLSAEAGAKSAEVQVTTRSIDAQTLEVHITFPGVWAETAKTQHGLFTRLFLADYAHNQEPGQPNLPVYSQQILLPTDANVRLEVVQVQSRSLKLADNNLPDSLFPVQSPAPKSGPQPPWIAPDPQTYQSGLAYPAQPAQLGETYQMRGYHLQPLQIWPVRYTPASGQLELLQTLTLRLSWPKISADRGSTRLYDPAFAALLSDHVLNPTQQSSILNAVPSSASGYLIITPDAFAAALAPLVILKQSEGYQVTLATFTQIGGSTTTAIKSYVKNAYDTWSTPPTYLLLVGDSNLIPAWPASKMRSGKLTDLYYATMNGAGDYVPDILYGRLPGRTAQQITDMVNKISTYAAFNGTESWQKKAAFIATCDEGYYHIAEGTHNDIISTYALPLGYTGIFPNNLQPGGDQLYCISASATGTNVVNAINDQRALITFSGHGGVTGWAGPSLTQSNVVNLYNNQVFPFVASFACETSDFANTSTTEVFGETWVLQPQKGAIAYLGSADYSYWDQDDRLERALYDSLMAAPYAPPTLGAAVFDGLTSVQAWFSGSAQYYWETYSILGDPSTRIWLGPRTTPPPTEYLYFYLPLVSR